MKRIILTLQVLILPVLCCSQILLTVPYEMPLKEKPEATSKTIIELPDHSNVTLLDYFKSKKYFKVKYKESMGYLSQNHVAYDDAFHIALQVKGGNVEEIYLKNKSEIDQINKNIKHDEKLWAKQDYIVTTREEKSTALEASINEKNYLERAEKLLNQFYLKESIENSDSALKVNNKSYYAHYLKGRALARLHRPKEAIDMFSQALIINPNDPLTLQYRGYVYCNISQFDEALKDATKLLNLGYEAGYYSILSEIAYSKNDLSSAIKNLKRGYSIDNSNKNILNDLAYFYGVALEEYDAGIYYANKLIELYPDYYYGWYIMGAANYYAGKVNENTPQYFNNALKDAPNFYALHYLRGWTNIKLKRYNEAIKDCGKALKAAISSDDKANAYNILGYIKVDLKEYDEALKYYNEGLEVEPSKDIALGLYVNRSDVKVKLKMYQSALNDCNKALLINPSKGEIYNNRGICHHYLGNDIQACNDYYKSLRLGVKSASLSLAALVNCR